MEQLETLQCMPLHVQNERISVQVFIGKLNRSLYWHFFFSPNFFAYRLLQRRCDEISQQLNN